MKRRSFIKFSEYVHNEQNKDNPGANLIPTVEYITAQMVPNILNAEWVDISWKRCDNCKMRYKSLLISEFYAQCLDCIMWPKYLVNPDVRTLADSFMVDTDPEPTNAN